MKGLYCIYDDSAKQVISLYFVAQSDIEAVRQFKGFVDSGNYPAHPKELSLKFVAFIDDSGQLYHTVDSVFNFSDSKDSYVCFEFQSLCHGDTIDSAYVNFSVLCSDDVESLKVQKNVSEAEFDEVQKNGDFGR